MTANPFTAKAKGQKPRLKKFGSKPTSKSAVNGKVNRWAARAANKIDNRLVEIDASMKEAEQAHEKAQAEERRRFKTVDSLEQKGKTRTQRYADAREAWDVSWRKLTATYNTLMSLNATRRQIIEEGKKRGT